MDITTGFFYLFSAVLLFSAFRVITAKNTVHATLFLVLAFFQASGIWMLLKAEFLSIALVLIYVGAVMVLFLFVVMMLDINMDKIRDGFWRHFPLAATMGVILALEMIWVIKGGMQKTESALDQALPLTMQIGANYSNTKELGRLLYTQYLYPVQIAAVILLVAIVAAIALTLRGRKDGSKHISPHDQIKVKARDRMELIKMEENP